MPFRVSVDVHVSCSVLLSTRVDVDNRCSSSTRCWCSWDEALSYPSTKTHAQLFSLYHFPVCVFACSNVLSLHIRRFLCFRCLSFTSCLGVVRLCFRGPLRLVVSCLSLCCAVCVCACRVLCAVCLRSCVLFLLFLVDVWAIYTNTVRAHAHLHEKPT